MSDPRHLLHVFPTFCAAGAQVRTVTLMRAFGDRFRHSVVACDGVTDAAAIADGVALELVPWEPRSGPMSGVRTAAELLRRLQPDLLCTYNWGSMDAVLAARAGGFARHVHHEDGFNADEADGLKARRNWTRRVSLRRTDMVVPSTKLETIARGTWRLPRVHLVPNGVDADRYARDAEAGARFRIERGIPADAFAVGVVGHLRPIKRFDRFLRAFAGAPWPNDVKPHALVVGDGGERAALEALAGSLDVGVTFTGHIEDLAGAYSAMDVFSLSSDSEQQPVSLLEALAAGTPVAATDVGDIAASLPPSARRFVVPLGPSVEAGLGQAYARLAGDAELRQALAEAGREHVVERYSVAAMVARYLDIYASALQR